MRINNGKLATKTEKEYFFPLDFFFAHITHVSCLFFFFEVEPHVCYLWLNKETTQVKTGRATVASCNSAFAMNEQPVGVRNSGDQSENSPDLRNGTYYQDGCTYAGGKARGQLHHQRKRDDGRAYSDG
jgi:hypothetical protein